MKATERMPFKELLIQKIETEIKQSSSEQGYISISLDGIDMPGTEGTYKMIDKVCEYFEKQGWFARYHVFHSFFLHGSLTLSATSLPKIKRYEIGENKTVTPLDIKYHDYGFKTIADAKSHIEWLEKYFPDKPQTREEKKISVIQKLKSFFK